jgi:hypothetical protein
MNKITLEMIKALADADKSGASIPVYRNLHKNLVDNDIQSIAVNNNIVTTTLNNGVVSASNIMLWLVRYTSLAASGLTGLVENAPYGIVSRGMAPIIDLALKEVTSVEKKTVEPLPGHYISAMEFAANSRQEFEVLLFSSAETYTKLASLSDKYSKTDILKIVASLLGKIPAERLAAIEVAYLKEQAVSDGMAKLEPYLNDIKSVTETSFRGIIKKAVDRAELMEVLKSDFGTFSKVVLPAIEDGLIILQEAQDVLTVNLK